MKIVFIADFFLNDVLGGGELNNEELIEILIAKGNSVEKTQSHLVTIDFIKENKNNFFLISNFVNLKKECRNLLHQFNYAIYEHDHKYLRTRNPRDYENFKAPKSEIVNYDFYKNAKAVFCQSSFHCSIVKRNLELDNIINLSGNLWTIPSIEKLKKMLQKNKLEKCSIMQSSIPHKNTRQAVRFCEYKNKEFELIPSMDYVSFLDKVSNNKTLVFFPKTPETLSRIIVEARMMGMSVITNELVGATYEDWYNKKGQDLIDQVSSMRDSIPEKVLEVINE